MNDDWRLRVSLPDERAARELTQRLNSFDLDHELGTSYHDRVIVSRDDAEVFCYVGTRAQADATQNAIGRLAAEHAWNPEFELRRWHPVAEEWADPDEPLPGSATESGAERARLMERERQESAEQGYPEYEVRVRCPSRGDASRLAEQLRAEGLATVQRGEFVVLGAADEDSAKALAARVRAEAPAGSEVVSEGSVSDAIAEAPFATPFSPFAVFGGLSG
jgi:hypothetical protein